LEVKLGLRRSVENQEEGNTQDGQENPGNRW